jgi:hypothetical protein
MQPASAKTGGSVKSNEIKESAQMAASFFAIKLK